MTVVVDFKSTCVIRGLRFFSWMHDNAIECNAEAISSGKGDILGSKSWINSISSKAESTCEI
jgi:hypothetical protein